jgi:hypothetical protein
MTFRHTADTMFERHPDSDKRRNGAIILIKYLLAIKHPDVLPVHSTELLSALLWKVTEAESHKYKTRFQTKGAIDCSDKTQLRHEHVFQRGKMIAALEIAAPHEVDDILKNAVGCTVTKEEHFLLMRFDDEYGWERYRKAGLVVIDPQTGERLI